ncbi:MAG: hypothetical protein ACK4P8_08650 [Tabrizicola sp.]
MTPLEDLLDQARDALVSGDLAALEEIALATDRLVATLAVPDRSSLDRLRRKAERNSRLLQAAASGVRSALGRLSEITAGPTLTTYDAQGRKAAVASAPTLALRRF